MFEMISHGSVLKSIARGYLLLVFFLATLHAVNTVILPLKLSTFPCPAVIFCNTAWRIHCLFAGQLRCLQDPFLRLVQDCIKGCPVALQCTLLLGKSLHSSNQANCQIGIT